MPELGFIGHPVRVVTGCAKGPNKPLAQGSVACRIAYQIASTHSGWSMNGLRLCW